MKASLPNDSRTVFPTISIMLGGVQHVKNVLKWNIIICKNEHEISKVVKQNNSDVFKKYARRLRLAIHRLWGETSNRLLEADRELSLMTELFLLWRHDLPSWTCSGMLKEVNYLENSLYYICRGNLKKKMKNKGENITVSDTKVTNSTTNGRHRSSGMCLSQAQL